MKQMQNSKGSDKVMKNYFENITDETLPTLSNILSESLPDHSRAYSMTSIFKGVSPSRFAKQLLKLSNKSKTNLHYFLARRYYLEGYGAYGTIYQYHIGDLVFITELKCILEKKLSKINLIDNIVITKLVEVLKQIIDKLDNLKNTAPSF